MQGSFVIHRDIPPRHRSFARSMRRDFDEAENVLWQTLRNRQLGGLKFKRQAPLDGYILDFDVLGGKADRRGRWRSARAVAARRGAGPAFCSAGVLDDADVERRGARNLDGICLTIFA